MEKNEKIGIFKMLAVALVLMLFFVAVVWFATKAVTKHASDEAMFDTQGGNYELFSERQ